MGATAVFKLYLPGGDTRRVRVPDITNYTMEQFRASFELAPTSPIYWIDEDKDRITIRTDAELREFLIDAARPKEGSTPAIYVDGPADVSVDKGAVTSKDTDQSAPPAVSYKNFVPRNSAPEPNSIVWCTNPPRYSRMIPCDPSPSPSVHDKPASPFCAGRNGAPAAVPATPFCVSGNDAPVAESQKPAPETAAAPTPPPFPAAVLITWFYWLGVAFVLYLLLPSFLFRAFVLYHLLTAVFGDSASAWRKFCDFWKDASSWATNEWRCLLCTSDKCKRKKVANRLTKTLPADHPLHLLLAESTTAADLRALLAPAPAPAAAPSSC